MGDFGGIGARHNVSRPGVSAIKALLLRVASRLWCHSRYVLVARLRRRFGREKSVVSISTGDLIHPSRTHAIFLIWQPKQTEWFVHNALDALAEAGVNVFLVVNHELSEERRRDLNKRCARLMIRNNRGLDMGAYRDATLALHSSDRPDRVIYMNDSVYYFREGLDDLMAALANSQADVCATFDSLEISHHVQSFCFSISGRLFRCKSIQEFWKNYLPANSRRWAIRRGEVAFGAPLMKAAESVEVIYSPAKLEAAIRSVPQEDLPLVPSFLSPRVRARLDLLVGSTADDYAAAIVGELNGGSMIHLGGFLLRKYLRCPLMKRDLVYRLQYDIHEIAGLLRLVGDEGRLIDILNDLNRKGRGDALVGWELAQFRQGLA